MKAATFFNRNRVFTYQEFLSACGDNRSNNRRTLDSLLSYHVRKGHLLRLRRRLFASVEPETDPGNQPVDAFLVASKIANDAVLAYHTALEFHGKAYSVHERFTYLTQYRVQPFRFRSLQFRAIPFPCELVSRGQQSFSVESLDRAGVPVNVTSLERTLVDVLDRSDLAGGWEEIWRSLELVEFFALNKVIEYTRLLNNATTAAKVGFFLEQHRKVLMVEDKHLQPLKEQRPKSPHYLERRTRKDSRLVQRWNLIVPNRILDRTWEEIV